MRPVGRCGEGSSRFEVSSVGSAAPPVAVSRNSIPAAAQAPACQNCRLALGPGCLVRSLVCFLVEETLAIHFLRRKRSSSPQTTRPTTPLRRTTLSARLYSDFSVAAAGNGRERDRRDAWFLPLSSWLLCGGRRFAGRLFGFSLGLVGVLYGRLRRAAEISRTEQR